MAALVAALWAYDGWNDLNMVAGEIRQPERNIPIALIAGVALVGGLYMLMNAAVQYVLPAAAIAASQRPASDAIAAVLGAWGAGNRLRGHGAVHAGDAQRHHHERRARALRRGSRPLLLLCARAMCIRAFTLRRYAIIVQAVLSIVLLLFGGNFRQLFSLAIFAEWLFYMIAGSTVFVFRTREPDAPRPYRVWAYPWVPALFLLAAGWLLYYTFTANFRNSLTGTLVILAGIPVFYGFRRKHAA